MADVHLEDLLIPDNMRLGVTAGHWQDAVRQAGELLVQAGAAQPEYCDAMVNTVDELGPYIVIAPGIALAHARPEDGVIKTGMSLVRLAQPVNFGHPDNDPVDLVFGLAATDHDAHVAALAEFAERFGDEETAAGVRAAESPDRLYRLIAG